MTRASASGPVGVPDPEYADEAPRPGRIPPHSREAEESLIGSMLLSRGAVETALATVRPEDLYVPTLARLFVAIEQLSQTGRPADPTTVHAWLAEHDPDPPIERKTLLELQAATPASVNAAGYARIVLERASRRRLARAGGEIVSLAFDRGVDAADALQRARVALDGAEIPVGGTAAPTVGEFLSVVEDHAWVWPGKLERTERLLLVAPEKFGKSTMIRQIGVLLAQGLDPFDLAPIPVCLVLIIDLENPPALVRRKVGQIWSAANTLEHPAMADTLRIECRPDGLNVVDRVDRLWLHEKIAASLAAWETLGWAGLPFVVALGPVYKLHENELDLAEVKKVLRILDQIRTRYGCALILETHAPHESFQKKADPRSLRPAGPRIWLRWPDFCRALEPSSGLAAAAGLADFYDVQGARDERDWPDRLTRGGRYPWLVEQPY